LVDLRLPSGEYVIGTMVWYYFVCKREVWLSSRNLMPDEEAEPLDIGRAIHEVHYKRFRKEISMEGIKIDMVRSESGSLIVNEVKTSSKYLKAAKFQLLYYLYRLKLRGIEATGVLLIPRERKRIRVILDEENEKELEEAIEDIKRIVQLERPPPPVRTPFCRKCAYNEFCWV